MEGFKRGITAPRVVLGSNSKSNRLMQFINSFKVAQNDRFAQMIKRNNELINEIKK